MIRIILLALFLTSCSEPPTAHYTLGQQITRFDGTNGIVMRVSRGTNSVFVRVVWSDARGDSVSYVQRRLDLIVQKKGPSQ